MGGGDRRDSSRCAPWSASTPPAACGAVGLHARCEHPHSRASRWGLWKSRQGAPRSCTVKAWPWRSVHGASCNAYTHPTCLHSRGEHEGALCASRMGYIRSVC